MLPTKRISEANFVDVKKKTYIFITVFADKPPWGLFTGYRLHNVVITYSLKQQKSDFGSKTKRQGGALLKYCIYHSKTSGHMFKPPRVKARLFMLKLFKTLILWTFRHPFWHFKILFFLYLWHQKGPMYNLAFPLQFLPKLFSTCVNIQL